MQVTSTSAPSDNPVPSSAIKLQYSRAWTRLGRRSRTTGLCVATIVTLAALCGLVATAARSGATSSSCGSIEPPTHPSEVGWELATAAAPKRVDIFGDFQCPDTKAAWSDVIEPMLARHGRQASIVFHPFPLPYHQSAFEAAQAALVMAKALPDSPFSEVASALFSAQASFYNGATVNITQRHVSRDILAPIASSLGVERSEFLEHMSTADPSHRQATVAWKYGAARGVSGTPTFAANGVIAEELASWSLAEWEAWLAS